MYFYRICHNYFILSGGGLPHPSQDPSKLASDEDVERLKRMFGGQ